MSKALNIRAAKALGWKLHGATLYLLPENHGLYLGNLLGKTTKILSAYWNEMSFTTSYDWAMLGVNRLTLEQFTEFDGKLFDITCVDCNSSNPMVVRKLISTATPEQITRAWVEVLEVDNAE